MRTLTCSIIGSIALLVGVLSLQAGNSQTPKHQKVVVTERGPNYRTWTIIDTNSTGTASTMNDAPAHHRVIELATGMHYWDGQQWLFSDPSFEVSENGFSATHTQHKVRLNSDLFVKGAVQVTTRDGVVLHSTPMGVGLYDAASGNFLLIGQLTNSISIQVASNQVVYPNAFDGVCANVVYTMEKGSFHQDVVFTGRLDPAAYGFPTNTTRVEMITEFYDPPAPKMRQNILRKEMNQTLRGHMASPDLTDQTLGFGEFVLGHGRAYLTGATNAVNGMPVPGAPVGKEFISEDGRHFLIEAVEYKTISGDMQVLPECHAGTTAFKGTVQRGKALYACLPTPPDKMRMAKANSKAVLAAGGNPASSPQPGANSLTSMPKQPAMLVANMADLKSGFVLDYVATVGGNVSNDFTFQSDTTYLIASPFTCYGTITFEGGAVLKTPPRDGEGVVQGGALQCKGTSYRPTILTSSDDDSVGDSMAGIDTNYTGIPTIPSSPNGCYLEIDGGQSLSHLRICYAGIGILTLPGSTNAAVWNDMQFISCNWGLNNFAGDGITPIILNNCLAVNVNILFNQWYCSGQPYFINNCTFDNITKFDHDFNAGSDTLVVTNSIFSNVHDDWSQYFSLTGDFNGFYNNYNGETFGNDPTVVNNAPFQSVGAGNYYLAPGTFQGLGTPNIDPGLLAELGQKTTFPPLVFADTSITSGMTLSPQATRDTNSSPDLGYHYDPIDYAIGASVVSNATLVIGPGTVIACFDTNGSGYGLSIGPGGQFLSQGVPNNLNRIVNYNMVQEQPNNGWTTPVQGMLLPNGASNGPPSAMNFRFTDFSVPADDTAHVRDMGGNSAPINFEDCQFHGGTLFSTNTTFNLTNSLLERVTTTLWPNDGNAPQIRNNLFWVGHLDLQFANPNGMVQNNHFDQTSINDHGINGYIGTFNGYVSNFDRLTLTDANDVILTNSLAFEAGPLGNYYQPTNSPLLNMGSTNANLLGLYHYTVLTNQVKEATSIVSIGYHYVATDANGNPLDTDSDGLADYLEDSNGNGIYDPGIDVSDWQNPSTDGSGMSDGWEFKYFGQINIDPHGDYDGDGTDNLNEYLSGTDPNKIQFSIPAYDLITNNPVVNVNIAVANGVPSFYAVFVDSTNLFLDATHATWMAYTSSNISVNVGFDGSHAVAIGLRGLPSDATQTWEETYVTVDTTPPVITLTSPTISVVSTPMLQIQGLVNKQLGSITYAISNASGISTNQPGYVTDRIYDTNSLTVTSNVFECYDVILASGANSISIQAVDQAGNQSTTNLNVVLDVSADTTPPLLSIIWPQDGTKISGNTVTLQVQVDDLTAQVTASANGATVSGEVQRGGQVKGLTLPVTTGTNAITVTATDIAGNASTNSLNVIQSSVNMVIYPLAFDQLNQNSATVTGTVSDPTETVLVNGSQATVNSSGFWTAYNVPVNSSGTANLNAKAYPNGADPSTTDSDGEQQASQDQPANVRIQTFDDNWHDTSPEWTDDWIDFWTYGIGGTFISGWNGNLDYETLSPDYYADYTAPWEYINYISPAPPEGVISTAYQNVQIVLDTGGKGKPGTFQYYLVYALMECYSAVNDHYPTVGVPPNQFQILGQTLVDTGMTNADGAHWGQTLIKVPAGTRPNLTPVAISKSVSPVPPSWGYDNDASGQDFGFNVYARLSTFGVAVDSGNTSGFEAPPDTEITDPTKDVVGQPGKIIGVNDGDADENGVPDYADNINTNGHFTPLLLAMPATMNLSAAKIRITYSASDPAQAAQTGTPPVWTPAAGNLRLWVKDANQQRNASSVAVGGDYVPSGTMNVTDLGFSSNNGQVYLYMEGIAPSASVGDQEIKVELDPTGTGEWQDVDAVRVTVVKVNLDINRMNGATVLHDLKQANGSIVQIVPQANPSGLYPNGIFLGLTNQSIQPAEIINYLNISLQKVGPLNSVGQIRVYETGSGGTNRIMDTNDTQVTINSSDLASPWMLDSTSGGVVDLALVVTEQANPSVEIGRSTVRVSSIPCAPSGGRIVFVNPNAAAPAAPYIGFNSSAATAIGSAITHMQPDDNILIAQGSYVDNAIQIPTGGVIAGLAGNWTVVDPSVATASPPAPMADVFNFSMLPVIDGSSIHPTGKESSMPVFYNSGTLTGDPAQLSFAGITFANGLANNGYTGGAAIYLLLLA